MVFFVHFLVCFAALCAFAVVAGIRLLVLRFAPASVRSVLPTTEEVTPFVAAPPVAAPMVAAPAVATPMVAAPAVATPVPRTLPALRGEVPLRLLPPLPTPTVLVDFGQDDPTLLESEPTRVWTPVSAPDLRIAR